MQQLKGLNEHELRRLLVEHLTRQKLGLYWEANAIERDEALNADVVLPRLIPESSCRPADMPADALHRNLIIEGDNFDALRLLRATHAGKIRVIYIDPPYNTGNKDWVYNDRYVGQNDRWRHSQWLEFLYRRLSLARDLLTPDGVLLVSINDENRARLELLLDEVMPGKRIGSFVWRSRTGGNDTKGAFLSTNHEHVLVYANEGFHFSGDEKSYSMYKYQEGDRVYRLSDPTKAHDFRDRPNTYYPVIDPSTGIHYPCNPQRVWAYASEAEIRHRLKDDPQEIDAALKKLRTDTIETLIEKNLIWFPAQQRVELFHTRDALVDAVRIGDVPKSDGVPLLIEDMPDLEYWVGKKIGYGRPQYKRFKEGLKNENQPMSSWLTPRQEEETTDPDSNMPIIGTTEEGSKELKQIMGDKAFPYPKPPSFLKALLAQGSQPTDIVLDFFAGSGTTAQAVLELNAEDDGNRRFILCSSTEANSKEPNKNLCRDVCAERVRRVIAGYGGKPGFTPAQGGEFAYLQLEKIPAADLPFELSPEQAVGLLALQRLGGIRVAGGNSVQAIGRLGDCDVLLCAEVNEASLEQIAAWPVQRGVARLAIYSPRPQTLAEQLRKRGVEANCYPLAEAVMLGQAGGGR